MSSGIDPYKKIHSLLTHQKQMSEAFIMNLLLAFSGGYQDAYTYIVRDNVFANAQTGNVVLMSMNLMNGNWGKSFRYLFPLISFMAGIIIADNVQFYFKNAEKLHWRQGILAVEALIMLASGFIPQSLNMLCNCLISFSCAMQVQSFRKVHGNVYASTMCIGNIRSGVTAFSVYLRSRNVSDLKKAIDYFIVILVFAIGAGIGGNLSLALGEQTIWGSFGILFICFMMMYIH